MFPLAFGPLFVALDGLPGVFSFVLHSLVGVSDQAFLIFQSCGSLLSEIIVFPLCLFRVLVLHMFMGLVFPFHEHT